MVVTSDGKFVLLDHKLAKLCDPVTLSSIDAPKVTDATMHMSEDRDKAFVTILGADRYLRRYTFTQYASGELVLQAKERRDEGGRSSQRKEPRPEKIKVSSACEKID